jgi:hypothetical protein
MTRRLKTLSRICYHWTTRANAKKIMRTGLRPDSHVARKPDVWFGEVCLRIKLDEPIWWYAPGCSRWQRWVSDPMSGVRIPPSQIRVLRRGPRRPKTKPGASSSGRRA